MTPDEHAALQELDRDGAIQEAAAAVDAVDQPTRASFMRRTGVFVGGGLALGAIPIALASGASGLPSGDIAILNYALTLEFLESSFYAEALKEGKLSGSAATFAGVVAKHEAAHVAALKSTLGSKAIASPKFDFKGTTGATATFLKTSEALETTGVKAYQGQVGNIKTPAVLAAAGSIFAVEARHASWVSDLIGHGGAPLPAPAAFSPALSMKAVLAVVKGTGFIK